jgi:cytosine/adenosine deaminase-related metal-dependent hydrolase
VDSFTLTARWIFPVDAPPLKDGTITICGERIQSVDLHGRRHADEDLGNVAILPGFVNAHTHLDLSGLKNQIEPGIDFLQWLRMIVAYRRSLTLEKTTKNIQAGIDECMEYGTTLVGDISSQGLSWPLLVESPIRSVVFYELLGLPMERAERAEREAQVWLNEHPATATCRPGVSPHAPYSVRASLFEATFQMARHNRVPLATHLAETPEELELLKHRRGPFVDFLQELGVWDPEGLVGGPEEIFRLGSLLPNFLVIHGNYLSDHSPLTTHHSPTVVYCPRTHAAFGHSPHPFQEVLAQGRRVALGTDSLASNPDLDVLAEARFVHDLYPNVPGDTLLRMITLSGAEALGWEKETGSLTPDKSADLVVLPLPQEENLVPYSLIFDSSARVGKVMCLGKWLAVTDAHPPTRAFPKLENRPFGS